MAFILLRWQEKKIKHVGKLEKQTGEVIDLNNSSFTKRTDVFAENNDHKMLLIYIEKILKLSAINSKEDELIANFCTGLYHLTIPPGKNLNETAIEIDEQRNLSWFDIETLNNAPTAETLKQMQSYFGTTNAGWLSKYVVDSYVSIVVAKSNNAVGSDEFGFLDIDNTLSIIEKRAMGNLKTFTATNCVSQTLTLRNCVFFPLLFDNHFFKIRLDKKCKVFFIDSIEQDRSDVVFPTLT